MKKIISFIRFFVGIVFIISGLIKLNDPMGFSFKLDEYFSEAVFNIPFLQPYSLSIALIVVILEILLGVALLLGYLKKLTLNALLALIVFFTFLTFYSAYFNKVTDCGCFGDAIKLTPWQSFTKDIVLLILILLLYVNQKHIKSKLNPVINFGILVLSLIACSVFGYYVLQHLPAVDFRAYKIGTNIPKGMEIPEDAPKYKSDIIFVYEVNGKKVSFGMNELNKIPENATFISREEKVIQKGYEPPIYNLTLEKDGADYLSDFLNHPKVLLIAGYELDKFDVSSINSIKKLAEKAKNEGYMVAGMTASDNEKIHQFETNHQLPFDFYFCDGTTIKTIVRANPGVLLLNYGVIIDKKHWNDIDSIKL